MATPDLGKMYGPLPLGAWVALIGGGLGIAYYYNKNGGDSNSDEATEDLEAGGMPGVGTGQVGGWVSTQNTNTASTSGSSVPADNDEWARLATNRLVAQGYDGATVASAIQKYLYGDPNVRMSVQETAMINLAIRMIGATPTPASGAPISPVPGPQPIPPPTQSGRPAAPRLKKAPTGLKVTGIRPDRLQLNVNALVGATSYRWYMTGRAGYVTSSQPVIVIQKLRPGRTYTFQVAAVNSAGATPKSASVRGTTSRK